MAVRRSCKADINCGGILSACGSSSSLVPAMVSLLPDGSIGGVRCKPISCTDGRGHLSKSPKSPLLLLLVSYVQACHTVLALLIKLFQPTVCIFSLLPATSSGRQGSKQVAYC